MDCVKLLHTLLQAHLKTDSHAHRILSQCVKRTHLLKLFHYQIKPSDKLNVVAYSLTISCTTYLPSLLWTDFCLLS